MEKTYDDSCSYNFVTFKGLLCAILLNDVAHINILHKRISCGLIIVLIVLQDDLFMFHCSELNNFLKKRWR